MIGLKVLVADDDPNVREIIRLYFEQQHIHLLEATDGEEALELVKQGQPDLVVLDVMMPRRDGLEVCRELRKQSEIPIIMLTARGDEVDRVLGLELGADDYVTKPFSPRELIARMKAVLRRIQPRKQEESETPTLFTYGGLVIDLNRHEVTADGEIVRLRPKEFDLLVHLARSPGTVHTREQLLDQVWGYDYVGDIRTVDVHVKKIREKLAPLFNDAIQTVWGVGYKFEVNAG